MCKAPYKVREGVRGSLRSALRICLTFFGFFMLALLLASALPYYVACVQGSAGWHSWRDSTLPLSPSDLDRVEMLKWIPRSEDTACRREGAWDLKAALVYGTVKVSGLGLQMYIGHTLYRWVGDGELAPPVLLLEDVLRNRGIDVNIFEYAIYILGAIVFAWYWYLPPWISGYMPMEDNSLVLWTVYEVLGSYCVMVTLSQALEEGELAILERRGGLRPADMLIYDRIRGTYH